MAVRAIARIETISMGTNAGEYQASVTFLADDGANNGTVTVIGIPFNIIQSALNTAIKTAVKDKMVNDLYYTFGLFDTITVIGAAVI